MKSRYLYAGIYFNLLMKIVVDRNIPYLANALVELGHDVIELPGSSICNADLQGVEALFVRTRTRCDAVLLDGTPVRFIGTATIGYDHIDADYCRAHGVEWANAPGCNADAVLQYVQSSVYSWLRDTGRKADGLVLGVVGVGQIGARVAGWAERVGFKVLYNDPPRAARGEEGFVSLEEIAAKCDIVTFHPTLSYSGEFPSYHLADAAFFDSLAHCRLLINASRGPVVSNNALLAAINNGKLGSVVLDVWENEPDINLRLLDKAYIATPHIAGYSAEGKMNASRMMLEAFAKFTKYVGELPTMVLPAPEDAVVNAESESDALLQIYSPLNDSCMLKNNPSAFEAFRNNYRLRREPSAYHIIIS